MSDPTDERPERPPLDGPARVLAIAVAGLAAIGYLLGFSGEVAPLVTSQSGLLLVGGGLLAGCSVLPRAARYLLPAVVLVVLGALDLLLLVSTDLVRLSGAAIVSMVVAVLQMGAAIAALLFDQGVLGGVPGFPGRFVPRGRAVRGGEPGGGHPGYPGYPPPGYPGYPGYGYLGYGPPVWGPPQGYPGYPSPHPGATPPPESAGVASAGAAPPSGGVPPGAAPPSAGVPPGGAPPSGGVPPGGAPPSEAADQPTERHAAVPPPAERTDDPGPREPGHGPPPGLGHPPGTPR